MWSLREGSSTGRVISQKSGHSAPRGAARGRPRAQKNTAPSRIRQLMLQRLAAESGCRIFVVGDDMQDCTTE